MDRPIHAGAQPLDDAGLVAFTPCGHRWIFPTRADAHQLHELSRSNLRIACGFCLTDWLDATHARACGTLTRVN